VSKQQASGKVFDPVKLEAMIEPLSVRVEKLKGNVRTPIPLPAGEDGSQQGSSWSKEDVRGLEQWLVTEWSGGGMYALTVTDATQPVPQKHEWTIFYAPVDFPERVPPALSAAVAAERVNPPQPTQVRSMSYPSVFPNGFPHTPTPAPAPAPQPYYVPAASYLGGRQDRYDRPDREQAASQVAEAERRRLEEQVREMQAQLQRAREEQTQTQHRQDLERAEQRSRAEQAAVNERFSRMEQLIERAVAAPKVGPDPAIEALREQNRMMADKLENERRDRESERRDRELRDLIQRQQDDNRRQAETLQQQLVLQQNKGPDPLLMFMQESSRQQADVAKEQARAQLSQMERMQTFMMNPRDIMALTKESSTGLDQITRQLSGTYQDIFQMQRSAVETMLQLSGGGNETVALIEKGLERASSFAERFVTSKTKEAVGAQQAQAQIASAQATAMQAQAQVVTVQAQAQAMTAQAVIAQGQRAETPMLNGPKIPDNVLDISGDAPVEEAPKGPKIKGRTDAEWFGPLTVKVHELRAGVAKFMISIQTQPPRVKENGQIDGVEPRQAANAILQAVGFVMENQIPVTAMIDLFAQGRIADFMDVTLPDAPQPYRDEVTQMIVAELEGAEDEDEDEDEDEAPEAEAATPVVAPEPVAAAPVAPKRNGVKNARA
jgi:hypothetical protein